MKFYELSEEDLEDDKKGKKSKKDKPRKQKKVESVPEKKAKTTRTKKEKSAKVECPHGHKFAKHWDEKKDCAKCKLNDACGDANEAL